MLLVETRGLEEGLVGVAITGGVDPVQVTFTDPGNPVLADLGFISVGIIAPDVARNGQAGPGLVHRGADLSRQGIDLFGPHLRHSGQTGFAFAEAAAERAAFFPPSVSSGSEPVLTIFARSTLCFFRNSALPVSV